MSFKYYDDKKINFILHSCSKMIAGFLVYFSLIGIMCIWSSIITNANYFRRANLASKYIATAILIVTFCLLIGLRYNVGGDFEGYAAYYDNQLSSTSYDEVPYEIGFYWLIKILNALDLSSQSLFVATVLIQVLLLIRIIERQEKSGFVTVLFYFFTLSFLESLNIIRQHIAFLFVILAIFEFESSKAKGILLYLAGGVFHTSAFFAFPLLIFLKYIRLDKYPSFLVASLLISAYFSHQIANSVLNQLPSLRLLSIYDGYLNTTQDLFHNVNPDNLGFGVYLSVICDIYLIIRSRGLNVVNKGLSNALFYNAYLLGVVLFPVVVATNFISLERGIIYLYGLKFLIYGNFVYSIATNGNRFEKTWIPSCIIIISFLFLFINALLKGAAGSTPYQTI